jgi:ketosteroid isomerase-like protein
MKNLIILFIATCLMPACQKQQIKSHIESPVDSLISIWNNAWNNHDSLAVTNMFEPNGILIAGNAITRNHNELLKMISPGMTSLSKLKSEKILEWSTADRAGLAELWEYDEIVNDSLKSHLKGAATFNWRKTENGEWKLTNVQIHNFTK